MRKLYNHNKHKIHPSPPPPPPTTTINHLSLLPLAIATLAAALSPADQEVLAYLISSSISTKPTNQIGGCEGGGGYHAPQFNCNCFSCYTSYWVRWDSSKNRQLIHEIIDAYEDGLIHNKKNKKHRKKNKVSPHAPPQVVDNVSHAPPQVEENSAENDDDVCQDKMVTSEKGSVRKVVNFIGGRIWGVWGI